MLRGKKVLITGGTGQVARPVVEALVADNEVWCAARFTNSAVERELAARGVQTWQWDMAERGQGAFDGLPTDFTHVMHAAVHRGDGTDFDTTVETNSVATGRLMMHCRRAEAFLLVSTGGVYTGRDRDHRYTESDPLGGQTPWLPTYPIGKMAAEGVARALAPALSLPTIIARLNVAYGRYGHGGVPVLLFKRLLTEDPVEVPIDGEDWCNPIHTDDIVRQVPLLWARATVPARIVNWGGDDVVSMREMLRFMARITGVEARFAASQRTRETQAFDNTLRRSLIGDCHIDWRDGLRDTVRAHFPHLALTATPC